MTTCRECGKEIPPHPSGRNTSRVFCRNNGRCKNRWHHTTQRWQPGLYKSQSRRFLGLREVKLLLCRLALAQRDGDMPYITEAKEG